MDAKHQQAKEIGDYVLRLESYIKYLHGLSTTQARDGLLMREAETGREKYLQAELIRMHHWIDSAWRTMERYALGVEDALK